MRHNKYHPILLHKHAYLPEILIQCILSPLITEAMATLLTPVLPRACHIRYQYIANTQQILLPACIYIPHGRLKINTYYK